jgi:hypothetical protein
VRDCLFSNHTAWFLHRIIKHMNKSRGFYKHMNPRNTTRSIATRRGTNERCGAVVPAVPTRRSQPPHEIQRKRSRAGPTHIPHRWARRRNPASPPRLDLFFSVWAPLTATGRARACLLDTCANGVSGWARRGSVGLVGWHAGKASDPVGARRRHDAWGRQPRGVRCQ